MKNLIKNLGITFTISFLLIAVASITACKKDKPTTLEVTIVDINGFRVKGAKVLVFGEPTTPNSPTSNEVRFNDSLFTNDAGTAKFDYSSFTKPGQAGFVTLNIFASKLNETGVGVARLEEQKNTQKTVIIQ